MKGKYLFENFVNISLFINNREKRQVTHHGIYVFLFSCAAPFSVSEILIWLSRVSFSKQHTFCIPETCGQYNQTLIK